MRVTDVDLERKKAREERNAMHALMAQYPGLMRTQAYVREAWCGVIRGRARFAAHAICDGKAVEGEKEGGALTPPPPSKSKRKADHKGEGEEQR